VMIFHYLLEHPPAQSPEVKLRRTDAVDPTPVHNTY